MDARGLAVLVAANNLATARDGSLRLAGVTPAVRRLLRAAGLDAVFLPGTAAAFGRIA
ncbi:STAS domain-containing protein [Actinomadura sp. ATCC 31491]|uniref:STAS domain-containing protein n=1 Tax=Actinomadura luzonensis TaxID=2805427 RepID=A0ABT0FJQ3_9ACTN|nr:STAS domain-containing protein [Actinomadura luzonensis]